MQKPMDEAPGPRLKILVVDDSVEQTEMLAAALALEGFEVTSAHSGPEALLQVARTWPDVVVMDIGMPGMNGLRVAQELRERGWAQGMRLIALTGYGDVSDRLATSETGFEFHFSKPVDMDALLSALRRPR